MDSNKVLLSLLLLVALCAVVSIIISAVTLTRPSAVPSINLNGLGAGQGTPVVVGNGGSCSGTSGNSKKSYILATDHSYGAFTYLDEKSYPQGFMRELISEVCPLVGIECRTVLADNADCWLTRPDDHPTGGQGLQGHWYDACAGFFATHERIQVFDFSMPFAKQHDIYFFIKKGSDFDPHDISGKKIGFVPGIFSDARCVARLQNVKGNVIPPKNIKVYPNFDAVNEALVNGEIDATVRSVASLGRNYTESESEIVPVRSMPFYCAVQGVSIMTRKDSDFIPLWNRGFMVLKNSGRLHKLCEEALKNHGHKGQFECVD